MILLAKVATFGWLEDVEIKGMFMQLYQLILWSIQ
jgi:hypothetical protein